MKPKGLYRTVSPTGIKRVFLDVGKPANFGEIPKEQYEEEGHVPPYDELPTKAQYQELHSRPKKVPV